MSTQIIKGLIYHYTTEQLATAMRDRAKHHEDRAAQKESALPELRKAVDTVKASVEAQAVAQMTKMNTNSYQFDASGQVEGLEADIKDHRNKALVFRTLADHLVTNATYELTEGDLRRLEIVK